MVRPGPSFSVQDVAFGWRDALRALGCTVGDFNFDDRLDFYASAEIENGEGERRFAFDRESSVRMAAKGILAACYEFWPDVVLIVSGFFVPPEVVELVRSRGHTVVYLFTESPYEDDRQIERAALADLVVVNDPTNLGLFRQHQPNTFYVPHAYDPARHYPGDGVPEMKCDFAFVGTGFPSRVAFFEACDFEGLDVMLGGSWVSLPDESPIARYVGHRRDWCIDNAEAADLYRSARASLNLYRREATAEHLIEGYAIGPREVELAACGTFFLRDPRPESDEVFGMLPTFAEPAEVRPLLDWWLAHDRERERVTEQARVAIEARTFTANAVWLMQHVT
jgi:spore maturation protein CgeB